MRPRCTKPKRLSTLRSKRTTRGLKLPSQAKSRSIFQCPLPDAARTLARASRPDQG